MPKKQWVHPKFRMGTQKWANYVFSTPPARIFKGPEYTQHHRLSSDIVGNRFGVQGGREVSTALAVEFLAHIGLLTRVKAQPFFTDPEQFGVEICPDFAVEVPGTDQLIVIETKSSRWLTRDVHAQLDRHRERFAEFGIKYLVWTDKRPLSHSVRHFLLDMRASANRDVTRQETEQLVAWAKDTSQPTLAGLYEAGFDSDCLFASAWRGRVFFPLTKPLGPSSPIRLRPCEDFNAIFLGCENRVDGWWHELGEC